MDDQLHGPTNGDRYIGVREWERARREDQRDSERHADSAALAVEQRLMQVIDSHKVASREAHKAQDDRSNKLADGLDGIKSIIDQQRGAKNLIVIFGLGTIINVGLNVLTILSHGK